MAGGVQVLDEPEVAAPRPPRRRSYATLATFLAGLVAGAVIFGPLLQPDRADPETEAESPVVPGGVAEPRLRGVAEVIDGFDEAMVAIVGPVGSVSYLRWAPSRGPVLSALPANQGSAARIDPSGTWVATITSADATGGILSLGQVPVVRPAVTGVDSIAWHDSTRGLMGLLRHEDGSWGLYEATNFPIPTKHHDLGTEAPGTLVAFGAWGWALQDGQEFVVYGPPVEGGPAFSGGVPVAPPGGQARFRGLLLDTHGEDFLYYSDGSVWLMKAGRQSEAVEVVGLPEVVAAAISPSGTRVAVLARNGIVVIDMATGHRWSFPLTPNAPQLGWSGERFVVVPASPRGVRVVDLERSNVSAHLTEYTVHWAATMPKPLP